MPRRTQEDLVKLVVVILVLIFAFPSVMMVLFESIFVGAIVGLGIGILLSILCWFFWYRI